MDAEQRSRLVEQALAEGPFTIQQLAADAGISYDSLYSWAKHRRVPKPENLRQLARAFERRAEALHRLSARLIEAADSHVPL